MILNISLHVSKKEQKRCLPGRIGTPGIYWKFACAGVKKLPKAKEELEQEERR